MPERADVEGLRAAAASCRGCELWEPATQVVFSAGNPRGRLFLVGEVPGDVEDRKGEPFVGPAGRLLWRAAGDAGLDRDDVYVTNAVKHFRFTTSGKRRIHQKPELAHIAACRPWVEAELAAVDPAVVVVLGATAARSLLGADVRVTKQRGQMLLRDAAGAKRAFVPTVHPSAVLRVPPEERHPAYEALVADLRVAGEVLASRTG